MILLKVNNNLIKLNFTLDNSESNSIIANFFKNLNDD